MIYLGVLDKKKERERESEKEDKNQRQKNTWELIPAWMFIPPFMCREK